MSLFDLIPLFSQIYWTLLGTHNITLYQWTAQGRAPLDQTYSSLRNNTQTYCIVHGWTESSLEISYEIIAQNYFTLDATANIILVDYGTLASENYLLAQAIVEVAGTLMGEELVKMINKGIVNPKRTQIFGHSLGTHVSGKAARVVKEKLGEAKRIARISASDPAAPLFRLPLGLGLLTLSNSLTSEDAYFVDVTHASLTMGTIEPIGTVDTYVGVLGIKQPGCVLTPVDATFLDEILFCDHRLARAYFSESILSCAFKQKSVPLDILSNDEIVYGQRMPLDARGLFILQVNASPPYAVDPNTEC